LGTKFYFAHPYSSWERGLNENTNGLLRQYFPKGTDFHTLSQSDVDIAVERINNRPRKTLGFKTATQMMDKSLYRITA
ncbi:MAG: IS30 family transposase, partial [Gammaproteobacteria bacterium CG22_combo_CG10-13_8_21_14_all_40_8]